jgi:hypothetical protein
MRSTVRTARTLAAHELRLLTSLLRWLVRRPHGVGEGRAFGYARGQGAMTIGLGFVCVVETVTMSLLLRGFPTAHAVFLLLDVYTLFVVAGLHAASVTRPHVLTDKRDGELALEVGSQTSVTLELTEPVDHLTLFGRRRSVRVVRFHVDDADQLVGLVREFTRVRTSPSPFPAPPG